MEIDFLRHFGFTPEIIRVLQKAYGKELLPLQERAIHQGQLFNGQSLLVCAPTSSGKTFLAEILFLHHAFHNRTVILMVPTKALANQRYDQWKERYGPLGYNICLSTRDHPFHDKAIAEGRFHLAIVIYEKVKSMLALRNHSFISSLGACIADEIHYLYDPVRGPGLEILLTRLREEKKLQILGLSAIVSDPQVASWLQAMPLTEENRPVELRQGILCRNRFHFLEYNSGKKDVETFPLEETNDEGQAMLQTARFFAAKGEASLLFWSRRDLCYSAARKLADGYEPDRSIKIPNFDQLEPTSLRDFLAYLIPRRIAVHTSDLSPAERRLVESAIERGEILLVCATGTLAEGINFPVVNVITAKHTYSTRPEDITTGKPPTPQPISPDRLLNMIGRAGRLGLCHFGRGIIVTNSPGDVDGLFKTYLHKKTFTEKPLLSLLSPERIILETMCGLPSFTADQCIAFLKKTLSGRTHCFGGDIENQIESSIQNLVKKEYLTDESGKFYFTPLGDLMMKNGLSAASAERLISFIRDYLSASTHPLELIILLSLLDEISDFYVYIPKRDIQTHVWSRALMNLAKENPVSSDSFIFSLLQNPQSLRASQHAAFKKSFLMFEWIKGGTIPFLEQRYGIYSGAIFRLTEDFAWLLGCLHDAAAAYAYDSNILNTIQKIREQMLLGLPENSLDWSALLRNEILSRSAVLRLIELGFLSPSQIHKDDIDVLKTILTEKTIQNLFECRKIGYTEKLAVPYIIELSKSRPDQIIVNTHKIQLTKLQAAIIHCLAKKPGECVDYDTLMAEVWPESIGDRKQISRQKTDLLKKISKTAGKNPAPIIETVPGIGLFLQAEVKRRR